MEILTLSQINKKKGCCVCVECCEDTECVLWRVESWRSNAQVVAMLGDWGFCVKVGIGWENRIHNCIKLIM